MQTKTVKVNDLHHYRFNGRVWALYTIGPLDGALMHVEPVHSLSLHLLLDRLYDLQQFFDIQCALDTFTVETTVEMLETAKSEVSMRILGNSAR